MILVRGIVWWRVQQVAVLAGIAVAVHNIRTAVLLSFGRRQRQGTATIRRTLPQPDGAPCPTDAGTAGYRTPRLRDRYHGRPAGSDRWEVRSHQFDHARPPHRLRGAGAVSRRPTGHPVPMVRNDLVFVSIEQRVLVGDDLDAPTIVIATNDLVAQADLERDPARPAQRHRTVWAKRRDF